MVYQPRAKEEIDRIAALVRTAIGFDAKRGDQIEVVNLRFADSGEPLSIAENLGWMKYFQFTKDDIMGAAEKGVMALLGLIVLLDGGAAAGAPHRHAGHRRSRQGRRRRHGRRCRRARRRPVQFGPDGQPLPPGDAGGSDSLTNTSGTNIAIVGGEDTVAISNRTSAMIDVAKVQGQVHAQSVQKVGELAEKNPHEAVSIIRSWLHEDAA